MVNQARVVIAKRRLIGMGRISPEYMEERDKMKLCVRGKQITTFFIIEIFETTRNLSIWNLANCNILILIHN